jgi:hypothetical protein
MSFKLKPNKKMEDMMIKMVDTKHNEFVERFKEENEMILPKLKEECILEKDPFKLSKLKKQIKEIQEGQLRYYLDNGNHLFSYFEEKKGISEKKSTIKLLNQFFKVDALPDTQTMTNHALHYLKNIDDSYIPSEEYIYNTSICRKCSRGELIPVDYDGIVICNNPLCACQFQYLIENEKPSYKEPPKEICFYAYKRINHFREILAQFQAKESTQIPSDIFENIQSQIKKERIEVSEITNEKTKEILKKFGYNKYYEHITFIKDKLGIKPPVMSPELEEKLCSLFIEIQRPYAKCCPDDRVNFLNYYYTIYKLCELLEEDTFLPYFPMLKDREKRMEQDDIWKKICDELNWQFIPTI